MQKAINEPFKCQMPFNRKYIRKCSNINFPTKGSNNKHFIQIGSICISKAKYELYNPEVKIFE